jgi:hypothetical protein
MQARELDAIDSDRATRPSGRGRARADVRFFFDRLFFAFAASRLRFLGLFARFLAFFGVFGLSFAFGAFVALFFVVFGFELTDDPIQGAGVHDRRRWRYLIGHVRFGAAARRQRARRKQDEDRQQPCAPCSWHHGAVVGARVRSLERTLAKPADA